MMNRVLLFLPVLALAAACCQAPEAPPESSVKPGINDPFLDPSLDVQDFVERFEVESREIFSERLAIVAAADVQEGTVIADIGAGTGLFVPYFSQSVGTDGEVYAVDISPGMLEHLHARKADEGWDNVNVVPCSERSADLPEDSVDRVFIRDTYHHFEYPRATMTSIREALRDDGEVLLVDFERIPGVTRPWLLDHVRCGKETVIAEMKSFGFELVEEIELDGLTENYVLRFREQ
jgi:ubiquinone/menaquinone biosynthesis C-methylase UbiE